MLLFGEYVMLWALVEAANFDPMDTATDQIVWTRATGGNYSGQIGLSAAIRGLH
jgi:hypothetical protein